MDYYTYELTDREGLSDRDCKFILKNCEPDLKRVDSKNLMYDTIGIVSIMKDKDYEVPKLLFDTDFIELELD